MKANIVLAFLILSFAVLPFAFAVDVPSLYTVGNYTTLYSVSGKRSSGPSFVYINGHLLANYGGIDNDPRIAMKESMDNGLSWGSEWTILTGVVANGFEFPMVAWNSYIVGVALDDRTPFGSYCAPVLVYSTNYGRSWTKVGNLQAKTTYCYPYKGIVTSDGTMVFSGWYPTKCFAWVCPKGRDPTVLSNWQTGSDVPYSGNQDEMSIAEIAPQGSGKLLAAMRTTGSAILWSVSNDYGMSWGTPFVKLASPAAPQALVRLSWSPDRIMLAWDNNGGSTRTPLCVAISESEDGSVKFSTPYQIASASSEVGNPCYPDLCVLGSGKVAVGYWVTDVTGTGGSGTGEQTRCAILTPLGGSTTYSVTVNAYCNNKSQVLNIKIYLDGVDTGHLTPYTIPNLQNTHSIQVEDVDVHGHPFGYWDNPPLFALFALSDSMTVSGEGTHTAYFDVAVTPTISWPFMVLFGVGAVGLVGGLYVFRWKLHLPKRRRHK